MVDRVPPPAHVSKTNVAPPMALASAFVDTDAATLGRAVQNGERSVQLAPGDLLSGRYTLGRVLGTGAFGQVFSAWDRQRSQSVAIKVLRNTSPKALLRFKREFRSISEIRHPNLVRVFELGRDDDTWYIVMELLKGVAFLPIMVATYSNSEEPNPLEANHHEALTTLLTHANRAPKRASILHDPAFVFHEPLVPVDALRDYFRQLTLGALALHELNIVHCDLKPSNIMLTPDDRVVILDLGVVRHMMHLAAQNQEQAPAGTRHYMAPEVAHHAPLTPAVDWYAVGVILWQFLTSQRAAALEGVSDADRTRVLDDFAARYPDYEALCSVCAKLLRENPDDRADHTDLLAACVDAHAKQRATRAPLNEGLFLGHDHELNLLHRAWDAFNAGKPQTIVIEGHAGVGKSALCANFLHRVQREDPFSRVLLARCRSNESLGFRAFDELVDGLTAVISTMEDEEKEKVLHLCTPALCRLFPVLTSLDPRLEAREPDVTTSDPRFALRELLRHVAARYSLIIWIEDIESSDEDSLQWIGQIFTPALRPNAFVLMTKTTRKTLTDECFDIETLGYAVDRIALHALDDNDTRTLIRQLLPDALRRDELLIERIAEIGAGLPEMLKILCRQANDHTELLQHGTGESLLAERIRALPHGQFDIFAASAISFHPQPVSILAFAAQRTLEETYLDIEALLDAYMLHRAPGAEAEHYEITHEAMRASVLSLLSKSRTRALHRAMVAAADELPSCKMRDLTLLSHMLGAGMVARARIDSERFANAAEQAGAYGAAARIYAQLIEMKHEQGVTPSKSTRMRAVELSMRAGQLLYAADLLADLADEAETLEEARHLRKRAEKNYLLCGHIEKSQQQRQKIDEQKRMISHLRLPRLANIAVLKERVIRSVQRLDMDRLSTGSQKQHIEAKLRTFRMVGLDMGIVDPVIGVEFAMEEVKLALKTNRMIPISRALAGLSPIFASMGKREQMLGFEWTQLAAELGERAGDEVSVQWAHICQANIDYQAGHYVIAWEKLRRGRDWLERYASTQSMMLVYANSHLIYCAWAMGKTDELRAAYYGQLGDVRARGNRVLEAGINVGGFNTWLIDDRPDAARQALKSLDIPPTGGPFRLLDFFQMYYGGEIALYTQQHDAFDDIIAALWKFEATLLSRVVAPVRNAARFLHARLLIARAMHTGDRDSRRLFMQLQVAGRQLRKSTEMLGQGWGHQILGASYVLAGKPEKAAPHYEKAISHFETAEIRIFAEPTRAAARALGVIPCDEDPFEVLRQMGIVDPLKYTRITHPNV